MDRLTKNSVLLLQIILIFSFIFSSCSKKSDKNSRSDIDKKPIVITTIGPYKFLLEELSNGVFDILNISEGSADPHRIDISPIQVLQLKKAKLFVSLNPRDEELILQSLGSATRIVEIWHGFPLLEAKHEHEEHDEHEEHEEAEMDKGNWDEHFWLNPETLKIQIATLAKELIRLRPEEEATILAKQKELLLRCTALAEHLRQSLPELENGKLFVFHSSLSYFADFFGAKEISIEAQGLELGAEDLLKLPEELLDLSYPVLIYAPQFEQSKSEALAKQLGLGLVKFDPQQADVFASLEQFAADLAASRNE